MTARYLAVTTEVTVRYLAVTVELTVAILPPVAVHGPHAEKKNPMAWANGRDATPPTGPTPLNIGCNAWPTPHSLVYGPRPREAPKMIPRFGGSFS